MNAAPPTVVSVDDPQLLTLARQGRLRLPDLLRAADALQAQGQAALAQRLYRAWLQRGDGTGRERALFHLGLLLSDEGDHAGARDAYLQAVHLAPDLLAARCNLGLTHERLGEDDAALAQWLWVDAHAQPDAPGQRPLLLMALGNLARFHEFRGRFAEAQAFQTRSLRIEPGQPELVQHLVLLRARQCLWPVFEPLPGLDAAAQRGMASALAMASLSDDPAEQLETARRFVRSHVPGGLPRLAPERPYGHRRLRIGYASGDFRAHPVAMLTVELLELHDRARFEVYLVDWSREDGSVLRRRVLDAADHVEPLHALDDAAAAAHLRSLEIDILVDLQGQTEGGRHGLLARRPAPVQITWLGLPATTALPGIDFVLADRHLIPEAQARHYSEQPLYLPDVFQPCDRQRRAAPVPTRAACGLPERGFVFCCFNNSYKVTAEVFRTWMGVLQQVPGSVLWLLADNPWVPASLRREALACGVDPGRLVFAPRVQPEHYLARYAVADLFLDTYPFNGGSTVNDALWMGLPVLTRSGRTFASRMAGSLLAAAGLAELACDDGAAYGRLAVALSAAPTRMQALRERLQRERREGVLFDMPRFVRGLEQVLEQAVAQVAAAVP